MASYDIQGSLLEACSCGAPCPCWIGEDPHGGKCDAFLAYRIEKGSIKGVDCAGVAFAIVALVPGNILKGNWKIAVYMTDKATAAQKQAVLDAWTGKLGGPLADLAKLVGEVRGVHDAPIDFRLDKGRGTITVGQVLEAEMAPYTDANGNPTTMVNTIFSTIPGSPAYVAKATRHKVSIPEHGMEWAFENRNLVSLLIVGYLGTWTLFGVAAFLADAALHATLEAWPQMAARTDLISAGLLLAAGLFQFSPLKYACLRQCRSPIGFVAQYWRGGSRALGALALGARHGAFCVGCCWALMVLMFGVGGIHLGWMLGLGAVMFVEKAVAWGRWVTAPVGALLALWGLALILKVPGAPRPF